MNNLMQVLARTLDVEPEPQKAQTVFHHLDLEHLLRRVEREQIAKTPVRPAAANRSPEPYGFD